MGTGYTRNDASNNIANGNVIDAADLDGEFDAIQTAFGTSGHSHDGTSAEGGAISVVGPTQEFLGDGSSFYPKSDATYDLGKSNASFDVAYVESINLAGTGITASAAEINYTDGVTSNIQTQLGTKLPKAGGTMTGDVLYNDNIKAKFGAGSDLQIYHDGSNSYIADTATGSLHIKGTSLFLEDADGNEFIRMSDQGAGGTVYLKNLGATKLSTTSTGISVTGNVTVSGTVDGRDVATDGTKLDGIASSANNYSHPNHTGEVTGSGALTISNDVVDAGNLKVTGNGTTSQFLRSDGDGTFTWATPTDTNTTYSVGDGGLTQKNFTTTLKSKLDGIASGATANVGDITGVTAGSGISGGGTSGTVTISHSDTSSQGSVNNSGRTYIQDITLDTYGHITGITSATETVVNTDTNTTYSAGAGLDLSGTTFSLESDARGDLFYMGRDTNDYFGVETTQMNWVLDGATDMRLYNSGDLHVEGNVIAYSTTISDERLKKDIVKIDNALDKVSQLNGYTFEYLADGKKSAGVIAQEVEKVMPSAITESTLPLKMGDDDETEYKTVQYDQLTGLLIEAIKELKAEIEELKRR